MEQRSLIERLARHLATTRPDDWPRHVEDAASIVALIKEPDEAMRAAGDSAAWAAMIDAALRERWSLARPAPAYTDMLPQGADEEGEFGLSADAVGRDRADWVHIHAAHEEEDKP